MIEYHYGKKISYMGEYKNGEITGKAKNYFNDKILFEGEVLNGKRWNGKGIEYENHDLNSNSIEYKGEYLNVERRK